MDRRGFLQRLVSLGVLVSAPWTMSLSTLRAAGLDGGGLSEAQWATLAAVQSHLFPSEPAAPGATEVKAAAWLFFVLSDTHLDPEARALIPRGLRRFEQSVQAVYARRFTKLNATQREAALRAFEQTPLGRQWITALLGYIFEALLTDPVYGGNPGGIGWRWLEHRPGFPRPPRDQRYFLR